MTDIDLTREQARRDERRAFFRTAGTASAAVAGASILSACFGGGGNDDNNTSPTPTPTPSPTGTATSSLNDADILGFALQFEYIVAQFYAFATTGSGLPNAQLTGSGAQGAVSGGRQISFTDPKVAQFAREMAADKAAHVAFLRTTLSASVLAQPPLDISANATGAFSAAARAAGLVGAGVAFDPYASDDNFLLAAFLLEDVGVTAYKGAAPLITSKTFLEAAAGLLAASSYHAGLVRTVLYRKGLGNTALFNAAGAISNARDALDGTTDLDQGIAPLGGVSNIVPTDANGIAYSRSTSQVLNIIYLTSTATTAGGFYPSGLNGRILASAAAS